MYPKWFLCCPSRCCCCWYIFIYTWKTFAHGFDIVTDLEVGPDDGYLYVVSLGHGAIYNHGAIYKILPAADVVSITDDVEEPEEEEDSDED